MDSSPGGSGSSPPQHEPSSSAPLQAPSSSWDQDQNQNQDLKRPSSQSQLLPPLELLSSSPGLPNVTSTRRQSRPGSSTTKAPSVINNSTAYLKYPTPVPTSSTGIISSSPPRVAPAADPSTTRQSFPRALSVVSVVSERAPLSAVPSIELNDNGDTLLMGRSSNSSHYQLSANRLISRVHVKARYIPASIPLQPNKIEVECNGWNGAKLHCQGRSYDMHKGEVLTFEAEGAEIMLDVQDARVLLHWPKRHARDGLVDLSWEDSPRSVRHVHSALPGEGSPRARDLENGVGIDLGLLQSSPLRRASRISSPVSPTPANASFYKTVASDLPSNSQHSSILSDLPSASERDQSVEIYEDDEPLHSEAIRRPSIPDQSFITDFGKSFSSDLSDAQSDGEDMDENNPNEENDPIITSFGPYGANLNNRMASFSAASPKRRRLDSGAYVSTHHTVDEDPCRSSKSASTPRPGSPRHKGSPTPTPDNDGVFASQSSDEGKEAVVEPDLSHVDVPTITNHVVNQLAFSRLSSNPLSTLLANLPAEDKGGLSREELKYIVEVTTCIGTIERQGKDADGKPLESQYYYVPEADGDENRRAAVVDGLRKPTLRNCRKHHVVRFYGELMVIDTQVCLPTLTICHSNTTGNARGPPERGQRATRLPSVTYVHAPSVLPHY